MHNVYVKCLRDFICRIKDSSGASIEIHEEYLMMTPLTL